MRERAYRRGIRSAVALAALLVIAVCAVAGAASTPPSPGLDVADAKPLRPFVGGEILIRYRGAERTRTVDLPAGVGVRQAARAARDRAGVAYAVPNYIARASTYPLPNDPGVVPGESGGLRRGWVFRQWNFLPCGSLCGDVERAYPFESLGGIDAVSAWQRLRAAGHEGASGVRVAVIDSGIAYRNAKGGYRRSPDFAADRFAPGYDFVQGDPVPLDTYGHGTHVAGTIGEDTGNGVGVTGLAYKSKLIPIRVLDKRGLGRADQIALGIRFAADRKADVINMSFNFPCAAPVPDVAAAIRYARKRGAVVVSSIGNAGVESCVSPPANLPGVIAVGGTTESACPGFYALTGSRIDLVAPGGGVSGIPCLPGGSPIVQMTLRSGSVRKFGLPENYVGTSMAAAHVSGVAAMVIASGVLGKDPTPDDVLKRLRGTARDLGGPGADSVYGAGLIDAGAATDPAVPTGQSSSVKGANDSKNPGR